MNVKFLRAMLCLLLLFSLLLVPISATEAAQPSDAAAETEPSDIPAPPPSIEASAAILLELNSDTVLLEQNADTKIYPASMTKIMTCLLTLENLKLSDTVTVSQTALDGLDESSSTADLAPGEVLTVDQLLYCMMLSSANEACNVAAEAVCGSVDAFVAMMNTRAGELGCTGTHFVNPHGLHNDDHYTTARDLSTIAREAMKNSKFREIVGKSSYEVPETNLHEKRRLTTTNQLLIRRENNRYYDKRVTGIKTGFTTPAGRCLIASAEDGTLSLLSVVCGCETRVLETGDLEFASFPETEKLLNYAFDNFTYTTVLTTLYPVAEIPVSRSAGANTVSLSPKSDLTVLLPLYYKPQLLRQRVTLLSEEGVTAPVHAGDELGTLTMYYKDQQLGSTELVAIADVERAAFFGLFSENGAPGGWVRIVLMVLLLLLVAFLCLTVLRNRKRIQKRRAARRRDGR